VVTKFTTPSLVIAGALFAAAPWIINAAPYESTMGLVQKIFYFHFPAALIFLIAAVVSGVYSAMFLFGKKPASDWKAVAAAEAAFVFGAMALDTGPLWALKARGVWWVWDPRLTSSLLVWMIFGAYLLLRRYGGPGSEKLAAGMALFGMAVVPFVYVSVNYWRTMHPQTTVVPTLPTSMGGPLWFCFAAMFLFFLIVMRMRVDLERQRARLEAAFLSEDER
jgi:heme exporter protein C